MHFNTNLSKNGLAITIDDGPIPEHCDNFLAACKEMDLKAYCFVVGKALDAHPDLAKKMVEHGHILCNHSYSHLHMPTLSLDKQIEEIERCTESILKHAGYLPQWFRFPYLDYTEELITLVEERGMHSVGVSMYTKDTNLESTPEDIIERLECNFIQNGIVIGHHWSVATRIALQRLLPKWRQSGIGELALPDAIKN